MSLKRIFNISLLIFAVSAMVSCSGVKTINLKDHEFGVRPSRIVWLQIAGLSIEHLAMLRFSSQSSSQRTAMERATCSGMMWNYNFKELRPAPHVSFMTQMTGKKSIAGKCEDYKHVPVWNFMKIAGYKTGVFESGMSDKESLDKAWGCGDMAFDFRDNLYFWRMSQGKKGSRLFHYQDRTNFDRPGPMYDRSCGKKGCFASVYGNVKSIYERFVAFDSKSLFIIRDMSYYKALKRRKILKAREILSELDKIVGYFTSDTPDKEKTLIIITSANVQGFEFPKKGREWSKFKKSGRYIRYHKASLISPVLARGPGSENFCGVFEELELLKRILWAPEKSKLQFGFLKGI